MMNEKRPWVVHPVICYVVLATFYLVVLVPIEVRASLLESRLSDGAGISTRAEMIEKVRLALEQDMVAQRLADYGLTAGEVEAKLATLSDEQLHQLAGLSDTLAEGGVLGAVIAILVVILLVILIVKLLNKEIIIR